MSNVDIWLFDCGISSTCSERTDRYVELLDPIEAARYQCFSQPRDGWLYLASRALIRTALTHYTGQSPRDWSFVCNEFGKPRLSCMPSCGPVHFNLSNTPGLIVCAVSRDVDRIGVDAEAISRAGRAGALVPHCLTPREASSWRARPASSQADLFMRYWTLKESYTKATGQGLSQSLLQFGFSLAGDELLDFTEEIEIEFADKPVDGSCDWRFAQWRIAGRFIVSLCVPVRHRTVRYRLRLAAPFLAEHGRILKPDEIWRRWGNSGGDSDSCSKSP